MTDSIPLQQSDLIFSTATADIRNALAGLKRSNLTITNRLHSIQKDADFVQRVASSSGLPLIANERCGSWYIPPLAKAGSAYFKSTDGHFGQWGFSLRRLNLQVLDIVGERGGYVARVVAHDNLCFERKYVANLSLSCIVVDSTRRGKSMPDALSKTVPIWICVLNRLLFPHNVEACVLHTPDDVVSESEHAQMEGRISAFVDGLRSLSLDWESLRSRLAHKPMIPGWVTPASDVASASHVHRPIEAYHKVTLCTASSCVSGELHTSSDYVQGAADDSESWACGLDASTFWQHGERLLLATEDELPPLISTLMAESRAVSFLQPPVQVKQTSIWIGTNAIAETTPDNWSVVISCQPKPSVVLASRLKARYVHMPCATGKVGSRQLRAQLPKLCHLPVLPSPDAKLLVACPTSRDLAVGIALAIICLHCRDDGSFMQVSSAENLPEPSKSKIKQRLAWIMVSMTDASPSRATLQSVNAFLMG